MHASHINPLTGENEIEQPGMWQDEIPAVDPQDPGTWEKVQRNAPCPCGSGRKYKHCHGALS
jgi:preprotein translocase subunit SecA